ncbi:hypothetical protein B0H19DRAFT_1109727 [Mycena capillaripes]|nr:hypothetical protein B0H19DRAFT_1109727 [Mycena capillaripes]
MWADLQLISSILLGSLSLIPNDGLRYGALASIIVFALVYNLYLNRATWLRQLEQDIQRTEEFVEQAKIKCVSPRDQLKLAQEWVRLLEIERSASEMRCRILEPGRLTWKQYSRIKRRVAECTSSVNDIRTAAQLILETERQRKLAEDIAETHSVLANARSTCAVCQIVPMNSNNSSQYVHGHRLETSDLSVSTR